MFSTARSLKFGLSSKSQEDYDREWFSQDFIAQNELFKNSSNVINGILFNFYVNLFVIFCHITELNNAVEAFKALNHNDVYFTS